MHKNKIREPTTYNHSCFKNSLGTDHELKKKVYQLHQTNFFVRKSDDTQTVRL